MKKEEHYNHMKQCVEVHQNNEKQQINNESEQMKQENERRTKEQNERLRQ